MPIKDANSKLIDGRYAVTRTIGRGMSGEVLLVKDNEGAKALKLLNELQLRVSRAEALASFKKEFTILKELNHPNIARILDFGYEKAVRKYFFTSEFVDGADFQSACTGLPPDAVEALAVQALRALNYLHARGINHFDIKPQNVLVALKGGVPDCVKIIDFGLADFTAPDRKAGTPGYMAPEILRGEVPDHRADLYSLGVMVYKAFTGINPFVGKNMGETADRHLNLRADPPSSLNPHVPRYWDHILSRLLDKDPNRRYAEAGHAIRDVNFLARKNFEIETRDTRLSYLPDKGSLIARATEWEAFQDAYDAAFSESARAEPRLVIIAGGKGNGKTRFISEVKYDAQLKDVPVRVYGADFSAAALPERFVLCIDDSDVSAGRVNEVLCELGGRRGLVVWACDAAPAGWKTAAIIKLKDYSRLELGDYLKSVTGSEKTPDWLVDAIYKRTQGNPLFVAEFVKSLIGRGVFFDSSGRWQETAFEDVGIDFDGIGIPATLEDCLSERISRVPGTERAVLNVLAVNGAPMGTADLCKLSGPGADAALKRLIESEFIESSGEGGFYFKNLLTVEAIRKTLPAAEKSRLHGILAALFAGNARLRALHLHHRGHDSDPGLACAALKELGRIHLDEGEYAKAAAVFERLIARREGAGFTAQLGDYLDLGKALTLTRRFEEASALYAYFLAKLETRGAPADDVLEVLKELVALSFKRSDTGAAPEHLAAAERNVRSAVKLIAKSSKRELWEVIFRNFEANLTLRSGRLDEGLATLRETHEIWKTRLSDEDKTRVLNNHLIDALHMKRDYVGAATICLEIMPILEALGEKYLLASNCYTLATTYYLTAVNESHEDTKELYRLSTENFHRCEKISRDIGNLPFLLRALNGIGNVHVAAANKPLALEYYNRAFAVSRRAGETETAAFIAYNIATIHKDAGNDRESYSHLIYAANTLDEQSARSPYSNFILFMTRILLIEIDLRLGDSLSAHREMELAESCYPTCPMAKSYESLMLLRRAQLYFHDRDMRSGAEWLRRAQEQCTTPEQRLIIDKYLASPQHQNLLTSAPNTTIADANCASDK